MNIGKIQKIITGKPFRIGSSIGLAISDFPLQQIAVMLALYCLLAGSVVSWVWLPILAIKLRVLILLVDWLWYVFTGVVFGGYKSRMKEGLSSMIKL